MVRGHRIVMIKKAFERRVVSSNIKNGERGSLDSTEALNRYRGAAPPGQGEAVSVQHRMCMKAIQQTLLV
jgi:hypothetical protein